MTATVEIKDSLVKKAQKITGITDENKLVNQVFTDFVKSADFSTEMLSLKDSDICFEGYNPKEIDK
jgi:Arc/MetJ family transcription regulator